MGMVQEIVNTPHVASGLGAIGIGGSAMRWPAVCCESADSEWRTNCSGKVISPPGPHQARTGWDLVVAGNVSTFFRLCAIGQNERAAGGIFSRSRRPVRARRLFPIPPAAMMRINRMAIVPAAPATGPASSRAIWASDFPPRRMLAPSTRKSCTAPPRQTPRQSRATRHVSELRRQHRGRSAGRRRLMAAK